MRKQTATARALISDTATQEDNAPLRVLWTPCHALMSDTATQEDNAEVRKQTATARALMSDTATQEVNAEVRKQMATARALMSDTATQEDNAEVRKQTATARALMSDTATQEDNAPLRVLWTPCHVSVIPAFLLIITAGNNYVSHTCHISNMCCYNIIYRVYVDSHSLGQLASASKRNG